MSHITKVELESDISHFKNKKDFRRLDDDLRCYGITCAVKLPQKSNQNGSKFEPVYKNGCPDRYFCSINCAKSRGFVKCVDDCIHCHSCYLKFLPDRDLTVYYRRPNPAKFLPGIIVCSKAKCLWFLDSQGENNLWNRKSPHEIAKKYQLKNIEIWALFNDFSKNKTANKNCIMNFMMAVKCKSFSVDTVQLQIERENITQSSESLPSLPCCLLSESSLPPPPLSFPSLSLSTHDTGKSQSNELIDSIIDKFDSMELQPSNKSSVIDKNAKSKDQESSEDENICVICYESDRDIVCLPCQHMCMCSLCEQILRKEKQMDRPFLCPICRGEINSILKIYKS